MSNPIGVNEFLLGATGSGKTHSIRTLIDAGLEVFVLFTEPGMEVLADVPPEKLHWKYIPPAAPSWDAMIDSAGKINTYSLKALSNLDGINKAQYSQFITVLRTLNNFEDDRTGGVYGDVSTWGPDRALVIDSLSGLNVMAMDLVVGSKPMKSMPDWGIAMDNLERLIMKLCADTRCHFVLIGHLEPERDETTGRVENMPSTLGRKLAPRLPRNFSDVIECKREGASFKWTTADSSAALKARNLPISDTLPPTFVPVIEKWRKLNPGA